MPEEKEPEGEARASKKEEAVEASTNNRGKKRTKSKTFNRSHAKEDLAEGTAKEAASKGHDGDEGSADYQADLQEMIDEIDRADAEPPCPEKSDTSSLRCPQRYQRQQVAQRLAP